MIFNNDLIKKSSQGYKTLFYIFLAFLILTIYLSYFAYTHRNKNVDDILDLEIVMNSSSVGDDAYLDVTYTPLLVASDSGYNVGYYLVATDQYMYVVVMNETQYSNLKEQLTSGIVRLYGNTEKAPDEFKSILISTINEAYSKSYTTSDYDTLVGQYVLNLTTYAEDNSIYFIYPIITAVFALTIYIFYSINKKKTNYVLNKYDQKEWNKICDEVNSNNYIKRGNTYITNNYILELGPVLMVSPLSEIVLVYQMNSSYNGIPTNKALIMYSKDRLSYGINSKSAFDKKKINELRDIATIISKANKDVLVGYTDENRKKVKELYNIKI
jgi:hypothetical protein